jgi:hypothetical protein
MSRAVMRQALEALENAGPVGVSGSRDAQFFGAIDALRAALMEPMTVPRVEAWAVFEGENVHDLYLSNDYDEAIKMAYYKGDHAEVKPLSVLGSNCIQPDHTLIVAARAVLDRWHSPAWEWRKQGPTAELMGNLQVALLKYEVK